MDLCENEVRLSVGNGLMPFGGNVVILGAVGTEVVEIYSVIQPYIQALPPSVTHCTTVVPNRSPLWSICGQNIIYDANMQKSWKVGGKRYEAGIRGRSSPDSLAS